MQRKIITTSDGSKTIQIEDWNEQYHSIHGAIQEANHVFLKQGLLYFVNSILPKNLSTQPYLDILEIGFGTGLNAFLTLIEAEKINAHIHYVGVEAYPVKACEISQLNYVDLISKAHRLQFETLHSSFWEMSQEITAHFTLEKKQIFFEDITAKASFDIIYFDAFGARVQPELWTLSIFKIMFTALKHNGILVTYAAKGSVRRAMQTAGFVVERLPGPPGKREMLRGLKR